MFFSPHPFFVNEFDSNSLTFFTAPLSLMLGNEMLPFFVPLGLGFRVSVFLSSPIFVNEFDSNSLTFFTAPLSLMLGNEMLPFFVPLGLGFRVSVFLTHQPFLSMNSIQIH